eukprot:8559097-Ditylum_brightwellii.AAC.1
MDGFKYAASLDLNTEYYQIELTSDVSKLCTIVLPWVKYEYCKLPMVIGFEEVMAYINDLLFIAKGAYEKHLEKLDKVLKKLEKAGHKVNMNKSFFAQ